MIIKNKKKWWWKNKKKTNKKINEEWIKIWVKGNIIASFGI